MFKKITKKVKFAKHRFIEKKIPKWIYKSRFLCDLYYFLFNRSFSREHQATLAGKVKHYKEAEELKINYFMLVRNIHRIEKGLLMRPLKPIFAKDYIKETVDIFISVWTTEKEESNSQLKWCKNVLQEYFVKCGKDEHIKNQQKKFSSVVDSEREDQEKKYIPYYRNKSDHSKICYDEFFKLTRQRRSVRWYLNKAVERDLIDKAILAGSQSPSACNRQPFEFRVFDDPQLVSEVVKFPMGTAGYEHSIPVLIVIIGNLDAYFDERDRHVIYIDASLANMSLMLALETLGLSSCSINWPDIEDRERKMENFLKLKEHQRPVMCLSVGYPDPEGMVAYSEKRPIDQVRKYNF